jgi:HAD superfamily hydrolase (TIGR01549 family)
MIKAVLFDLGDTLWHFPNMPPFDLIRGETMRRIFDLLRSWGVEPEGELLFLGRDIRFAIEKADTEAYNSDCVSAHFPTLARDVAAQKGLSLSDEQALALWHTWNLGGIFLGRTLFDDVFPTLDWLRQRGYRIGSVTNRTLGGEPFRKELRHFGLLDYFEVLSISCDVGYMKPHPKIFEHALDALDLRPEEAVMVGDSLRADVGGSQALGMTAVWKRDNAGEPTEDDLASERGGSGELGEIRPDFIVDNLWEITELPIFQGT